VPGTLLPPDRLGYAIVLVTLAGGLGDFLSTVGRRGPARRLGALGRWAVRVALGASFGGALLCRHTFLPGRITFLLKGWPCL
jgi:hypothetical protein